MRLIIFLVLLVVFNRQVLAFSNNLGTDYINWSFEKSGSVEKITKLDQGWLFEAGGENASTHYSRVKYKLPEKTGNAMTSFYIKMVIELPTDFYEKQKAGFRIINTDNYGIIYNGVQYGAINANELRSGVYINSQHMLQVVTDYETQERKVLWSGEALSVGVHTIEFFGNVAEDKPWGLIVDGVNMIGGNTKLSPNSVPLNERIITRIVAGIDGAADQDNNSMNLIVRELIISDGLIKKISDYNSDGKVDLIDFGIWKIEYLAGKMSLVEFGAWKREYLK